MNSALFPVDGQSRRHPFPATRKIRDHGLLDRREAPQFRAPVG